MDKLTTDQLLILVGYAGALVGGYISILMKIKALEIKVEQAQKDVDDNQKQSQVFDERVTRKFDQIMTRMDEKFEVVNDKMNELIREFTKH